MMKIIADESIPYVQHYFGHVGELVLLPGRQITPQDVRDADLLLVRSVTKVNRELLGQSNVKWVGSVTAGSDHLDLDWLTEAGIAVNLAHGFNAQPVAEYVVCVIAALQEEGVLAKKGLRAGIIGLGATGSGVAKYCQLLGATTTLCDPIRARNETDFHHTALDEFENLDLISLHVPLTYSGEDATYHFINHHFLERQNKNCVLINASRGAVVNSDDLLRHGQHLQLCLDVWEHEPHINLSLLAQTKIATPHMAGYSLESKQRGIEMVYHAAVAGGFVPDLEIKPITFENINLDSRKFFSWQQVVLQLFNPLIATQELKDNVPTDVKFFDTQRLAFNHRREFSSVKLSRPLSSDDTRILTGLGCEVS